MQDALTERAAFSVSRESGKGILSHVNYCIWPALRGWSVTEKVRSDFSRCSSISARIALANQGEFRSGSMGNGVARQGTLWPGLVRYGSGQKCPVRIAKRCRGRVVCESAWYGSGLERVRYGTVGSGGLWLGWVGFGYVWNGSGRKAGEVLKGAAGRGGAWKGEQWCSEFSRGK